MTTADAILKTLASDGITIGRDGQDNVVDALKEMAHEAGRIADAITVPGAEQCPGTDATGGSIASLTEACMGMTAGLCKIADAISELADAVRESKNQSRDRPSWEQ